MRVRFLQNLGILDARSIKDKTGADVDAAKCKEGADVDIPAEAVAFLEKKYPALLETGVKGIAPAAEIQAVPPETEPLKRYKEKGTVKE